MKVSIAMLPGGYLWQEIKRVVPGGANNTNRACCRHYTVPHSVGSFAAKDTIEVDCTDGAMKFEKG